MMLSHIQKILCLAPYKAACLKHLHKLDVQDSESVSLVSNAAVSYMCNTELVLCRDDILPCRVYLRHCVLAAGKLGESALRSFLDHTYLADRQTTVRQHLHAHPGIMTEQPPPSLLDRYNG